MYKFNLVIEGKSFKDLMSNVETALKDIKSSSQMLFKQDAETKEVTVETKGDAEVESPPLRHIEDARPSSEEEEVKEEPTTPESNEDLDADGLPWDRRIHSSSKTKTTKGVWKRKRGVKQADVEKIEEELLNAQKPAPAAPEAPSVPKNVTVPEVPKAPGPEVEAPAKKIDKVVPPPQPEIAPEADGYTLEAFKLNAIKIIIDLNKSKKIDPEYIGSLCAYFNVPRIYDAIADDAMAEVIYEEFIKHGLIKGA